MNYNPSLVFHSGEKECPSSQKSRTFDLIPLILERNEVSTGLSTAGLHQEQLSQRAEVTGNFNCMVHPHRFYRLLHNQFACRFDYGLFTSLCSLLLMVVYLCFLQNPSCFVKSIKKSAYLNRYTLRSNESTFHFLFLFP